MRRVLRISSTLAERLAFLGGGAAWLTTAGMAAEPMVVMAAAAAGTATTGYAAIRSRMRTQNPETYAAVKRIQNATIKAIKDGTYRDGASVDEHAINEADELLTKHVVACWPTPKEIAKLAQDPSGLSNAVAEHVLVEIAQEKETLGLFDPSSNNCLDDARDFARHVVKVAMEAGLEEDGYFKTIKPHLLIENLNLTAWVAEQLPSINSKIQSVKDDTQELIQGNKKILALLMAQTSGPTDPFADESIQKTLNRLLSTQDARRRAAAKHLRRDPPDRQAAVRDLKQLAAEQDDGVAESAAKTAETHREIAALTYYSDGEEAVRALEKVVAYAPDDHVSRNQLGLLLKRLGRLEGARQAFEALLEMHAEDTVVRAVALGNLGVTAQVRGDLDGAEAYLKQSLALQKELGRKEGMANQLGNLGVIAQVRGDLDGAEAYHQESLTLDKELGRKEGMAKELGNLGLIAQVRGDLDGAEVYLKESLALNEELGRKEGMAIQLGNLGVIAQTRGDLDGAEAYHKQSLALNEELGRKEGMAASLGNLGVIAQTRGDLNEAEAYNQESQALHKELGHKEGMARNLVNLGNVAFDRGDRASACAFYRQAESLFAEIGMRRELEQARALIAERCPHDAPSE